MNLSTIIISVFVALIVLILANKKAMINFNKSNQFKRKNSSQQNAKRQ